MVLYTKELWVLYYSSGSTQANAEIDKPYARDIRPVLDQNIIRSLDITKTAQQAHTAQHHRRLPRTMPCVLLFRPLVIFNYFILHYYILVIVLFVCFVCCATHTSQSFFLFCSSTPEQNNCLPYQKRRSLYSTEIPVCVEASRRIRREARKKSRFCGSSLENRVTKLSPLLKEMFSLCSIACNVVIVVILVNCCLMVTKFFSCLRCGVIHPGITTLMTPMVAPTNNNGGMSTRSLWLIGFFCSTKLFLYRRYTALCSGSLGWT